MSMALHGSKLAAKQIHLFLQGNNSRERMEQQYTREWHQHFASRLKTGRRIQRLFGRTGTTNSFIAIAKYFPGFTRFLIRQTHGKSF
jgi:flavin-dependent dehydrogenase